MAELNHPAVFHGKQGLPFVTLLTVIRHNISDGSVFDIILKTFFRSWSDFSVIYDSYGFTLTAGNGLGGNECYLCIDAEH